MNLPVFLTSLSALSHHVVPLEMELLNFDMDLLSFLVKSSGCLAFFLMFYHLLLERERMHTFKRYYLLAALVLALVIPVVTFTEYIEPDQAAATAPAEGATHEAPMPVGDAGRLRAESDDRQPMVEPAGTDYLSVAMDHGLTVFWTIYILGIVIFGLRFLFNLWKIVRNVRKHPNARVGSIVHVLLKENLVPHTFWKYLFLNRRKFESGEIPREVLLHEGFHARQRHSLDVLFVELLHIVLWFNPLIYLTKKAIKLNHEYLADAAVVEQCASTSDYQNILLEFASSAKFKKYQPSMANAIHYSSHSSIKKRFIVMKTRTSKKSILLRNLLLVPLLAFLLYGFSTTVQIPKQTNENVVPKDGATKEQLAEYNALAKTYNAVPKGERVIPAKDLKILETIYAKMTGIQRVHSLPFPECPETQTSDQEGATKKQVREYNGLAKKYNTMLDEKGNIRIKKSEVERLEHLHGIMTGAQRAEAEPFPDFPEPPEPPEPPLSPDHSEIKVEENSVQNIIENQELSNESSVNKRTVQEIIEEQEIMAVESAAPKPSLSSRNPNQVDKPSGWVVSTVGNRDTRKPSGESPLPPVLPAIAIHAKTGNYSKELKHSLDKYLEKSEAFDQAVTDFTEKHRGSPQNLWDRYNEAMEFYVSYYNIAHKESNFVQPNPAFKRRGDEIRRPIPPSPPASSPLAPKSPFELLQELKKENARIIINGKETTYDNAERVLKENNSINVKVEHENGKRPIIKLSTE